MTSVSTAPQSITAIHLEAHRSLLISPASAGLDFAVKRGLVSVETRLSIRPRWIMEFLCSGDTLLGQSVAAFGEIRLRAHTDSLIERRSGSEAAFVQRPEFAIEVQRAIARARLANVIVGIPQAEARVASFLLDIAYRSCRCSVPADGFAIELAREDVADHILINPDTLSRTYSRLRDLGALQRSSGTRPVIRSRERLAALSPIAQLISKVCDADC